MWTGLQTSENTPRQDFSCRGVKLSLQLAVRPHPAIRQRPRAEQLRLLQRAHLLAGVPRGFDLLAGGSAGWNVPSAVPKTQMVFSSLKPTAQAAGGKISRISTSCSPVSSRSSRRAHCSTVSPGSISPAGRP